MVAFRAQDYIHPLDRTARENLEQIPGLRKMTDLYLKAFQERTMRQMLMSQAVRLGPRQMSWIYRLLPPVCEAYGIEEPELYITHGPLNAFTFGQTRTCVVLYSGLMESLDEPEIQAVIAHECGHILSEHVLLKTMAHMLEQIASTNPIASAAAAAVRPKLMDWSRKSELSADRAAIAFMGDVEVWLRVLMRFGGVPRWIGPEQYSIEEFIKQAAEFEDLMESRWEKILSFLGGSDGGTHPLVALRAREAQRWTESRGYSALTAQAEEIRASIRCTRCATKMAAGSRFCENCGEPMTAKEITGVGI
jgi:Zn-dependent protease with chaperone function